ncbi:phosphatidate cytidylyltransferase [Cetobacterium sp. SF1]|uniref:phosphatidate cytidylyltransferase n=1 Tax=unclassified Cetobacterium TaxID=2630983 RepID=UPI003CE9D304
MINRIIVALIGIPILVFILLNGGLPLLLFSNLIILIGIYEFYKMAELGGKKPFKELGYIGALLIPNLIYFYPTNLEVAMIFPIVAVLLGTMSMRVISNKVENSSEAVGITLVGVIYVSVLFSHLLLMSKLPNGGKWLLAVQILVWVCDSFAYFTGISIGRKFFKNGFSVISPKKSVEGSLGGIFFTMLTLYLMNKYAGLIKGEYSLYIILILGFAISILAQIGDLGESMFKREFKIKDSGKILGEHGGILDRFDSILFVIPTVYYILKFFTF